MSGGVLPFALLMQAALEQAPSPPQAVPVAPLTISARLTVIQHCAEDAHAGEVVVCGTSRDRYRLPLPPERDVTTDSRVPGEAGSTTGAITPFQPCGIFAGERRCGKAEAARFGYGGGRDPISVLVKVGSKLVNPDGEISPSLGK